MLKLRNLFSDESGVIALNASLMFILLLPALVMGFDYTRVWFAEKKLQDAVYFARHVDISSSVSKAGIEEEITAMVEANYNSDALSVDFSYKNNMIYVHALDTLSTPILSIFGKENFQIAVKDAYQFRLDFENKNSGKLNFQLSIENQRQLRKLHKNFRHNTDNVNADRMYRILKNDLRNIKQSGNFPNKHKLVRKLQKQLRNIEKLR